MEKTIYPLNGGFNKELNLPSSKSITNRVLLLAAISQGKSIIRNPLICDDSYWCMDSLQSLNINLVQSAGAVAIEGNEGLWDLAPGAKANVGSAGTTGRFLTSILACSISESVTVTSSEQLANRPMSALLDALRHIGCQISGDSFPLFIEPMQDDLLSNITMSGGVSSQFVSGVMMAAPMMPDGVEIKMDGEIVQDGYVDITIDVMKKFGVDVLKDTSNDDGNIIFRVPHAKYVSTNMEVEVDCSTASYFLALAAANNSKVTINGFNCDSLQPDRLFVPILERMGCFIQQDKFKITLTGPEKLKGGFVVDMKSCSDTVLTLACIAPFCDEPIEIRNVEHIRHHESDRISAISTLLQRVGIKVIEYNDGLKIFPGNPSFKELQTYEDHRIAMALTVLGASSSGLILTGAECVAKTCPDFFEIISGLGVQVS